MTKTPALILGIMALSMVTASFAQTRRIPASGGVTIDRPLDTTTLADLVRRREGAFEGNAADGTASIANAVERAVNDANGFDRRVLLERATNERLKQRLF